MIRILLVDDVQRWRDEIRHQLSAREDFVVVGEASTGLAAIDGTAHQIPDLVLLDIGLPDISGVQVAERIREVAPGVKIIFVTSMEDAESARTLVNDGADGYLLKSNLHNEILFAVAQVIAGRRFISQQLMG